MTTDTIGDFLTNIRNAVQARHKKVDVPASKMRVAISDILVQSGFIRNYKLFRQSKKGVLRLYLKYMDRGAPVIHGLSRVSKPSRRVYVSHSEVPDVMGGIGVAIISTSNGIVPGKIARESKVGGEYLCKVW